MTDDKKPESLAVRLGTVREWLALQGPELAKVLPRGMEPERFARIVLTACARQPKLTQCSRQSFVLAVMEAAALGLEPDSALGLAYLVPYKDQATLIVGYKGLIQLAYRHPRVLSISAEVVREKDQYVVRKGLRPALDHTEAPPPAGEVIAAYAVAHIQGGGRPFVWMWREEIEAHRARSQSWRQNPEQSPWTTDETAMFKKTASKQLGKFIPASPLLLRALAVDDADPEVATVVDGLALGEAVAESPDPLDKLAEALEKEKA